MTCLFLFVMKYFVGSLENWYYRILLLITGNLKDAEIAVDALSIWYALFIMVNLNFIFILVHLNGHGIKIKINYAYIKRTVTNLLGFDSPK